MSVSSNLIFKEINHEYEYKRMGNCHIYRDSDSVIDTYFFFDKYTVNGDSMYPELKNEDEIIVSKISKNLGTINRGDIIIFRANENHDYIKRLIGKPGDTVNYKDDSLYINGKKVEEPYLTINKELSSNNKITQDFKVNDISGSHGKKLYPIINI